MTRRSNGFTFIELLTVLFVLSVIAAVAFYTMSTFRRGYSVSNESRNLTIALQQTRMRALQNEEVAVIKNDESMSYDSGTALFQEVKFTTNSAHGFDTGDYITVSGLTGHTGMNGGIFYVTKVSDTEFTCPFYHKTNESVVETASPKARNLSKAAKLIIVPKPTDGDIATRTAAILATCSQSNYFCYDGENVVIWDRALSWAPGSGSSAPSSVTVAFDSRGFPYNQGGYELGVAKSSATDAKGAVGIVVSPFGNVKPSRYGTSD